MRFWDTSALLPLIVGERSSDAMRGLIDVDPTIVVWWATRVEIASAIARRERSGSLTAIDADLLLREIDTLGTTWLEVQPVSAIRPLARRLLRTHALRAADALQLAAAVAFVDGQPDTAPFVCLDDRLTEAARREGLVVIDGGGSRSDLARTTAS